MADINTAAGQHAGPAAPGRGEGVGGVDPLAHTTIGSPGFVIPASWLETRPAWYEVEDPQGADDPDAETPVPTRSRRLRPAGFLRLFLIVGFALAAMLVVDLLRGGDSAARDLWITSSGVNIDEDTPPSTARPQP